MSEPFLERLSRFTPDAGGLDRDALLFAAGRESARPNRPWIAFAAALAVLQPLSLIFLWPHPTPPATYVHVPVVVLPASSASFASAMAEASENPGIWSARHSLLNSDTEETFVSVRAVTFVESGPPLRALGPLPPSILN
ncbi:MAG TPA: hypothetical protein VKU02_24305 [Gemmataceae bacterium]|nr:hypothetical protein [Gemmataceae bacterium]